jgi:transposase
MASLTRKRFGRRVYYYLRECRRVDGRPKIVRQVYLGTAEQILHALQHGGTLPALREATVREFGALAALYDLARRLDLPATIDRHVPKRPSSSPSVGTYLLLAALNRAFAPRSKAAFAPWYEKTALARWIGAPPSQLTSQRFWEAMDRVSQSALEAIEEELARRIVKDFAVDLRCLFYDATNFFTYIDSFNDASTLAQRGHNKQGHDDLRQLGLALLVTHEEIPLFHLLYPGNEADVTSFRAALQRLLDRYRAILGGTQTVTLVFDKGNNAEDVLASLGSKESFHFVGSLVPTHHPDLLAVPRARFRALRGMRLEGVEAFRTKKEVFGTERTVVVTFNPALFQAQVRTLERELGRRRGRLRALQRRLRRWAQGKARRGRPPTIEQVRKALAQILRGRHMKELFGVDVSEGRRGRPKMSWRVDAKAWAELRERLLGKTLIFTDQEGWSEEEIVLAYRGQSHVESCFRQMKDPWYVPFRPQWHWTDQKVRVHAFYCVVALLLVSLLRRELARRGEDLSVRRMLEGLGGIREVEVLCPGPRGRPRTRRTLTAMDAEQRRLFDLLELGRYTAA